MAQKSLALPIIALVAVGAFLALYGPSLSAPRSAVQDGYLAKCSPMPGYITIIENSQGFNDSRSHGAPSTPWPIISVHRGDRVQLEICNLDSVETHGFAIDRYFDAGRALRPGQVFQVSFVADVPGTFRIFCDVFCSVHAYMVGSLDVS